MTPIESKVPVSMLMELIRLDAETGNLYWLPRLPSSFHATKGRSAEHSCSCWNSRYAFTKALASVDGSGHLTGRIFNEMFYAHRVVFAMTNGSWPVNSIDHINGNPSDNRPVNLRDVTHIVNLKNQAISKNNTSGVVGVSFNKRLNKWASHITVCGKYLHLGFHEQIEKAISARKSAEIEHGFHKNHGRTSSCAF